MGGGDSAGVIFLGDDFLWGRKFPVSEFSMGNFTLSEFARISMRNSTFVLLSLCRLNFTLGDVKCNCPG